MAKHTEAETWDIDFGTYSACISLRDHGTIAHIPDDLTGWKTRAKLMAAAPDMKDSLADSAYDIENFRLDMVNGLKPDPTRLSIIIKGIETSIAKAKGEQS